MVDRIKYSVMWVLVSSLFSVFWSFSFFFFFFQSHCPRVEVICRYLFMWFHCTASALDASYALWISANSRSALYSCFFSCLPIHWPHKKLSLSQVSRSYEYLSHIRKLSRNEKHRRESIDNSTSIHLLSFYLVFSFSLEKPSNCERTEAETYLIR